jgi:tetratricopeptide (TPR) repeat protein
MSDVSAADPPAPLADALGGLGGTSPAQDDFHALAKQGQSLGARTRFKEAERVLRRAVQVRPDEAEPRYHLAQALAGLGRAAEASDTLRGLLELGKALPKETLKRVGLSLMRLADWAYAERAFRAAPRPRRGHAVRAGQQPALAGPARRGAALLPRCRGA